MFGFSIAELIYVIGFLISIIYTVKVIYPRLKLRKESKFDIYSTCLVFNILWFIFVPWDIWDYLQDK